MTRHRAYLALGRVDHTCLVIWLPSCCATRFPSLLSPMTKRSRVRREGKQGELKQHQTAQSSCKCVHLHNCAHRCRTLIHDQLFMQLWAWCGVVVLGSLSALNLFWFSKLLRVGSKLIAEYTPPSESRPATHTADRGLAPSGPAEDKAGGGGAGPVFDIRVSSGASTPWSQDMGASARPPTRSEEGLTGDESADKGAGSALTSGEGWHASFSFARAIVI